MNWRKIFYIEKKAEPEAHPLHIAGVPDAPLTPEPDAAEIAAMAVLEQGAPRFARGDNPQLKTRAQNEGDGAPRDAAYYEALAERMRKAQDNATLRALRFVAFCEQELKKSDLPLEGKGSLGQLEAELYKRIDTIDRVGGDLKKRWQRCLAETVVRMMKEVKDIKIQDTKD